MSKKKRVPANRVLANQGLNLMTNTGAQQRAKMDRVVGPVRHGSRFRIADFLDADDLDACLDNLYAQIYLLEAMVDDLRRGLMAGIAGVRAQRDLSAWGKANERLLKQWSATYRPSAKGTKTPQRRAKK